MNNGAAQKTLARCDSVQAALFDYLARELSAAQSDVVREHLRRCEACRRAAAELQRTVALLRAADRGAAAPRRLSDARQQRLAWAIMHPLLEWIHHHHVAVSIAAALLALALAAALIRGRELWAPGAPAGVSVSIGGGAGTNAAPPAPLAPPSRGPDPAATMREAAWEMLERGASNAPAPAAAPRE